MFNRYLFEEENFSLTSDRFSHMTVRLMGVSVVKRLLYLLLIVLVVSAAGGLYGFLNLKGYAEAPLSFESKETLVTVQPGERFDHLLKRLKEAGIIQSPFRFRVIARLGKYDQKIRAGEYLLSPDISPLEILEMMSRGKVYLRRMTVPEGYTIAQIDALAAEAVMLEPGVFSQAATNSEFVRKQGISAETLEGYLFPDTYFFPKGAAAETIVQTMLERFRAVFSGEWEKRAAELGFSVHEVVTLASIIEKETGDSEERPLIASVFHNRLKRKMRLQSDPTVIYGAEDYEGNLTRKHLDAATPYNTYRTGGLPPGPIANPGEEALRAALYPAESKYLYFVSKGDATHQFSTNLADHNRAVRKYQLGKGKP